ncbi:MAG: isoleucine--tRNA ligase [Chitinophagaceae bacterium]|nr:isoleucine--tRNA ligase [Chitinophagaceae bacterium]
MTARYREFSKLNLPSIEQEILLKWNETQAFEESLRIHKDAPPFIFYEGPPSANGLPGIHHVISRSIKDLICRYKTMQGFQVNRKGGWDTHGLPVELGVEKMLGITKEDIGKKISVAEYNDTCRKEVLRYKDRWDELTRKMGYWVDLQHPYITFQNSYIETLWWLLKELYKKGLLYESVSVQPYSPAAGTGLSSHELNQPGTYKMVKDTSAVVMFNVVKNKRSAFLFKHLEHKNDELFFLAWTTTPWTLPSNLALTVGPNIRYVLVKTYNPYTYLPINVILAKDLVKNYFKPEGESADLPPYKEGDKILPWKILAECKGSELEEIRYEQLLPFEANAPNKAGGNPFRVLLGDFVTTEDGTGIVHTAPAFGADDFKVGKKYEVGILTMVDRQGKFVEGLGEFSNRYVKNYTDDPNYVDVNVDICVKLKKENRAFKIEKFEHNYPHCWRTDKPVLYYPLDAWFIRTTAVKEKMLALNETINWKPKATGEGRFGNWLENMVDWNLSRSRYWGTPLPVWRTEDGAEEKCIGSIPELEAEIKKANEILGGDINKTYLNKSGSAGNNSSNIEPSHPAEQNKGVLDLHKPYVDEIVLVSESGRPMRRVPDLIDVWFDSGSMPYAQWGLDYEKLNAGDERPFKAPFNNSYPADFICEGVDQTRGWFYTLHAVSTLLFGSVAFKTCVSNGLVLDKNGNKMSKRLGNVIDPFKTIEEFGADSTRWYLITNASPWDSMKFDLNGIREVQRKFFGTLYNTYQFFVLYANVDGFAFKEDYVPVTERPEIDRWILSSLNSLIKRVNEYMDDYEPTQAGRAIEDFVDAHLSNWYVRLCRRRFWKGEYEHDKICAYQTLYECLETIARLMAPIAPFFSDSLFQNLNAITHRQKAVSVHHTLFPKAEEDKMDRSLEERVQLAQDISSLALSLRKKVNIKVRQPLQKILIPVLEEQMKKQIRLVEELIKTEINVKEIAYLDNNDGFIKKKIKPNYVLLGKRLGPRMKAAAGMIGNLSQEDIAELEKVGHISLLIDNEPVILQAQEVEIASEDIPGWMVANKEGLTVALDVNVTPELESEGYARELVNRIQKIRKDNNFELTDRIIVRLTGNENLKDAVARFNSYICAEILADQLNMTDDLAGGTEVEINDILIKVIVTKKA